MLLIPAGQGIGPGADIGPRQARLLHTCAGVDGDEKVAAQRAWACRRGSSQTIFGDIDFAFSAGVSASGCFSAGGHLPAHLFVEVPKLRKCRRPKPSVRRSAAANDVTKPPCRFAWPSKIALIADQWTTPVVVMT